MKSHGIRVCTLFLSAVVLCSCSVGEQVKPITAILGAFDAEVEYIQKTMTAKRDTVCEAVTFTLGFLEGRHVVLTKVGVGKVNAAMTTTLLLEHFNPSEVIFTGIAGGLRPDLYPGDIVIGSRTAYHDFVYETVDGSKSKATRDPISGELNPIFFPVDEKLLSLAMEASSLVELSKISTKAGEREPEVTVGLIVTGDAFIASNAKKKELRSRLNADAVEMEGAAVAQLCFQKKTPCLVVRSISDRADSSAVRDVNQFYRIAANNSAALITVLVRLLNRDIPHSENPQ
jgi:adenosylhomocysteine nucleosidase